MRGLIMRKREISYIKSFDKRRIEIMTLSYQNKYNHSNHTKNVINIINTSLGTK